MTKARNPIMTAYAVGVGLAAMASAGVLVALDPVPSLVPVLILGGLLLFSENTAVELPSGGSISASFVLLMAAVMVFRLDGSLAGPVLVSLFGCLYFPHLRNREWRKVSGNLGAFGLATLAATLAFQLVPEHLLTSPLGIALGALVASVAYFAVNGLVVAGYYVSARGGALAPMLRAMARADVQVYPFAVLGLLLGRLYIDYGAVMVPLFVVPLLVARQGFASYLALKESQEAAVRTLIGALEAKDPYTAGHAERVANYAEYIGQELGMSPSRLERLRFAALMHDVGKLVVPNHLLNKKGKLTAEEFSQVRMHEDVSVEILTRIDFLAPVAPSATSEAAEFAPVSDDRGQPIEPHIVAVADAFDAMTSTRSYRKALPQETAFSELRRNSGKQFHPRVVDALISAIERRGEEHGRGHEDVVHHADAPEVGTGSAGLGDLLADATEHAENGSEQAAGR